MHVITAIESHEYDVNAMTILGDELFIVSYFQPEGRVTVYDATNFTFKRNIRVRELDPDTEVSGGLTSCATYDCLYISCSRGFGFILRVGLNGDNSVVQWRINDDSIPRGLSINSRHNVMAACGKPNQLMEYSTHGNLVRVIPLPDDFDYPMHAIQLNNGHILVSHGYGIIESRLKRVCIVDTSGRVLLRYGHKPGSKKGQLDGPEFLAVDRNGFIYVADCGNSRIVMLDNKLKWIRDIKIDDSVNAMCFDEQRSQLLISDVINDCEKSRVFVVKV